MKRNYEIRDMNKSLFRRSAGNQPKTYLDYLKIENDKRKRKSTTNYR